MILRRVLNPERVVLAVEDNKVEAIAKLDAMIGNYPGIELVVLPTMYPQGSEKQLIQSVTKRQVPPGQLPVSVGCAVFNVATFAAIYRAVRLGMPLVQRIVTISGEAIDQPQNFVVRIGTPFHDLIEVAGGLHDKTERVISGGPMMGVAQFDLSVPVTKGTNAVTILGHLNRYIVEASRCIRCGKCIDACPMKLMPVLMYKALYSGSVEEMKSVHMMDCIECGSCAYTCPACVPLVLAFRSGKHMIRDAAAAAAAKKS